MTTFEDIIHLLFTLWSECELPELTRQSVGQVPTLENKHHPTTYLLHIHLLKRTTQNPYRFSQLVQIICTPYKTWKSHFSNVLFSNAKLLKCKSWYMFIIVWCFSVYRTFFIAKMIKYKDSFFDSQFSHWLFITDWSQDSPPVASYFFVSISCRSLSKRERY